MHPQLNQHNIVVPETVYELLIIEVNNYCFTKSFQYQIQNAENKTIRKGSFSGNKIQLRLNSLYAGKYTLILHDEEQPLHTSIFEKRNELNSEINGSYYPLLKN
jgi:hypothetical protein